MRKYGILLIICIFQILLSCTKVPVGPSLKDILSANSKLQVVLDKYKDDSLKYLFIRLYHFTEFVQLVVQNFAVTHSVRIIKQGINMKVYFNNPIFSALTVVGLHNRLRLGFIYKLFLQQS